VPVCLPRPDAAVVATIDARRSHIASVVDIVEKLKSMKPSDFGERSIVTGDSEPGVAIVWSGQDLWISEMICYFNNGEPSHADMLTLMACSRDLADRTLC
jgi:hypothetical protein